MIDLSRFTDVDENELRVVPLERSETIPSDWYTEARFLELELEAIFSRTWQYVGPRAKLRNPGDQTIATVARNPIITVRGNDNTLRAFYNVCRHRGGPLATEDCSTKVLQCKYHGWTYLLDGSLRGTPKFDRVDLFDKKDFGLVPVALENWEDLLFVQLEENGLSLPALMQGIKERIAPMTITGKQFFRRVVYDVHANWKVYVDNYLEGYHIPHVHPELATLLDYQNYVTETFEHYSLQHSPLTDKDNIYSSGKNGNDLAFYYFVWPNFMLNILPGRLQTNIVLPVSHNRTQVIFDYYYDDISSPQAQKRIEEDIAYSDKIQQEDGEICELVQRGLESRAYTKGRFSVDCENGVYHFQSLLKQAYRKALTR